MNLLFEKFKEALLGEKIYTKYLRNRIKKILKSETLDMGKLTSYAMHYSATKYKMMLYVSSWSEAIPKVKFTVVEFEKSLYFARKVADISGSVFYKDYYGVTKDSGDVLNDLDNYMETNLQLLEEDKKRYGRAR